MNSKRGYVSLYFGDSVSSRRKKGYITISFNAQSPLYRKCKNMGASKIKSCLGVKSYKDLKIGARREDRTISNYIRHRLNKKLVDMHE